jgi:hypothetical protein
MAETTSNDKIVRAQQEFKTEWLAAGDDKSAQADAIIEYFKINPGAGVPPVPPGSGGGD